MDDRTEKDLNKPNRHTSSPLGAGAYYPPSGDGGIIHPEKDLNKPNRHTSSPSGDRGTSPSSGDGGWMVITGIGTEMGKTGGSAVIVEALQAGFWNPVQA